MFAIEPVKGNLLNTAKMIQEPFTADDAVFRSFANTLTTAVDYWCYRYQEKYTLF